MTNTSQFDRVLAHITDHPGCSSPEISIATRIRPSVISALLTGMARENLVVREKTNGMFRYSVSKTKPEPMPEPVNLNKMFNSLLKAARESRA